MKEPRVCHTMKASSNPRQLRLPALLLESELGWMLDAMQWRMRARGGYLLPSAPSRRERRRVGAKPTRGWGCKFHNHPACIASGPKKFGPSCVSWHPEKHACQEKWYVFVATPRAPVPTSKALSCKVMWTPTISTPVRNAYSP